jgi:hypothetical protein
VWLICTAPLANRSLLKQSLQLCDFLGNSANAVRWPGLDGSLALSIDALSLLDQ